MKENTVLIVVLSLLFLAIIIGNILRYSKREFFKTHKKNFEITFIYIPIALSFLLLTYHSSDSFWDFVYVNMIFTIIIGLIFIIDKRMPKDNKIKLILHFSMYILIFLVVREANRHLILPMAHNCIIVIFILNLRQGFNKNDNSQISILFANLLGVIAIIIMFYCFNEPFDGISKQECIVKNYLLEKKGYNENDIMELRRLTSSTGKEKRVFVSIGQQDRKAYIYHYKNGSIIGIEELKN
jgi:fluoride ion exporter CrcB/FEX